VGDSEERNGVGDVAASEEGEERPLSEGREVDDALAGICDGEKGKGGG
jgi:hypothetical protein